jgi:iron complex outermembrane receptor protein
MDVQNTNGSAIAHLKLPLAVAMLALLMPTSALAVLEEVIVTAQKREENVQTVPIAVSVFDAETLQNARLINIDDIALQVPGFTVTNFNPVTPQPFIRGVGSSASDAGSDASIGVFIDGVYAGRAGGYRADLYDIQQVEVLRGPQGTLFGRNVAGGAVTILSNMPESEAGGDIELTGGDYSLFQAKAMVTGPLSDNVSGRIALNSHQRDGYVKNTVTGNKLHDEDTWGGRGRLLWDVSDRASALLTGEYTKDDLKGPSARNYEGADPSPVLEDLGIGFVAPFLLPTSKDNFKVEAGEDGFAKREMATGTLQLDWDLDLGVLTSISGYRNNDYSFFDDLLGLAFDPGSPFDPLLTNSADEDSDQYSQELRLNSSDDNLVWTVGLYYLNEQVDRAETFSPIGVPVTYDQEVDTSSYAIFGQFAYPFYDAWSVTIGGRYSYDEKEFDLSTSGMETGFGLLTPDPANPNAGAVNFTSNDDESWSNFSPKFSLEYSPKENIFSYFTVARGYKSGGYNGQSTNRSAARSPFEEEKVTNYEIGLKTDFFDSQVRLNVAAYYMDYEDLQVFVTSAETTAGLFVENGDADISGFEAEFYYSPAEPLNVTATYAYLKAELGNNNIVNADEGNTLTRSPENSASFSVQYTIPLREIGDVLLRADYVYQDKIYFLLNNPELSSQDDYSLLNLRLALQARDNWELALWAKNVTDEEYWVHAIDPSYGSDLAASGIQGNPRTYGVTAAYRW